MALKAKDLMKNIPSIETINRLHRLIEKYNLKDESIKLDTIKDEDDFFFLKLF